MLVADVGSNEGRRSHGAFLERRFGSDVSMKLPARYWYD
jgi:hypothetical protein